MAWMGVTVAEARAMGGAMTVERGETLRAIARDGEAVKWRHELGACFGVACESDSTSEPESAKCGIVDSARLVVMMVRQVMVMDGREDAIIIIYYLCDPGLQRLVIIIIGIIIIIIIICVTLAH